MTDLLKQKREELKRLEKETIASHKALSLKLAHEAVAQDIPKQAVDFFFKERVETVEFATADHVEWVLGNRLQGGSYDQGVMATITLKGGVEVQWKFNQQRKGTLKVLGPGKKSICLDSSFGHSIDLSDDEFDKELNMKMLIPLLGAEMAEKTQPFTLEFSGLWFGTLEVFLAAYAKSMRQCPVKSEKPVDSCLLKSFWGQVYML
jgi:hypothetical protein